VPSEQEVAKLDTSQKPVFNLSYVGAKFDPPGVHIVGKISLLVYVSILYMSK
jgi:hypothetical protein